MGTLVQVEGAVLLAYGHKKLSLQELLDEGTSNGATDLELLDEYGSGDAKDLWHFLDHSLELSLFQINGGIKLLFNLNLCP